jgi:2-succinyl-5-enolpyruvyl-6-hydroxy-3-cyclohexene-1-carboxylate synthase
MVSESKRVQSIVEIFAQKKIEHIVFSPGSRNAPLIISLVNDERFNCISIVDERSAAFYALGIALELKKPVAICCTSGSASLNYSSAISEAFYQNIPLIVITTDRPPEWINHGEGQSIEQIGIYKNITHSSFPIPIGEEKEDIWFTQRQVNEAINNSIEHKTTVHINIPFREPLYKTQQKSIITPKIITKISTKNEIKKDDLTFFINKWNSTKKILILCGQSYKDEKLNYILEQISHTENAAIFTESTSNLSARSFIPCIDRTITSIDENEDYSPDLLITIGGAIISKKIKTFLREVKNLEHWSINEQNKTEDTYQKLNYVIPLNPNYFFRTIFPSINLGMVSNYKNTWLKKYQLTTSNHDSFMKRAIWSDLKAFDIIYNTLPENCNLHLGNSSPVRYMQLFNQIAGIFYYSNRGVSGIDGSTSTMCGVASVNNNLNIHISGDLSFVYDINSLWNNHLTSNVRIIVINNSGGGIFRLIPGPSESNALEEFFEVGNNADVKALCDAHNINYYKAIDAVTLDSILPDFYNGQDNNRPAVLEIHTPNETNAKVLKEYFKALSK